MKICFLLLFNLILFQNKVEACEEKSSANGLGDCEKVPINDEYDEDDAEYCCYITGKKINYSDGSKEEIKTCWGISEETYDKLDDYINVLQERQLYSELSIDCGSNHFMVSFLSFILLLLLL